MNSPPTEKFSKIDQQSHEQNEEDAENKKDAENIIESSKEEGGGEFEVSMTSDHSNSSNSVIRIARCARSSNSNVELPAHSVEVPFDHVIGNIIPSIYLNNNILSFSAFDPALRPHSLLMTHWQNVKTPSLSDPNHFIVQEEPKYSLMDVSEQEQVIQNKSKEFNNSSLINFLSSLIL